MSSPPFEPFAETALRWIRFTIEDLAPVPPKRKRARAPEMFGQRLARLRRARGLSQRGLAARTGISQRMIAHYETQSVHPPGNLLPQLAEGLGVTIEQLLAVSPLRNEPFVADVRVWRRMRRILELPPATRRAILKMLDAVLDRHAPRDA